MAPKKKKRKEKKKKSIRKIPSKKKSSSKSKTIKKNRAGSRSKESSSFMEKLPLHSFLLALYPVFFIFSYNIKEMYVKDIIVPSLLILAGAAVIYTLIRLLVKETVKTSIISSAVVLVMMYYGQIYEYAKTLGFDISARILFPLLFILYIAFMIYLVYFAFSFGKDLPKVNSYLNYFSLILIIMVVFQSVSGYVRYHSGVTPKNKKAVSLQADAGSKDIYYIMVDGHGRRDILKDIYGYDNSSFIESLEKLGFTVPKKAMANYASTLIAMGAFMNYEYMDKVAEKAGKKSDNRFFLKEAIRNNRAISFLKSRGYRYIVYPGGHSDAELQNNADMVIHPQGININNFGHMLLNMSALNAIKVFSKNDEPVQFDAHRKKILFNLDNLEKIVSEPSPKIVFSYIVSPHPPFVFDRWGNPVKHTDSIRFADGSHSGIPVADYIPAYAEQVEFIDKKILRAVEDILRNSKSDPIIIIHADHGPGSGLYWENFEKTNSKERLSVFAAYHLPGVDPSVIPEDMSPVNNFRLIFSNYFNEPLPLLENRAYYSKWSTPYDFIEVTAGTY